MAHTDGMAHNITEQLGNNSSGTSSVMLNWDHRQSFKQAQILGWQIHIKDQIIVKNKNLTFKIM